MNDPLDSANDSSRLDWLLSFEGSCWYYEQMNKCQKVDRKRIDTARGAEAVTPLKTVSL